MSKASELLGLRDIQRLGHKDGGRSFSTNFGRCGGGVETRERPLP